MTILLKKTREAELAKVYKLLSFEVELTATSRSY